MVDDAIVVVEAVQAKLDSAATTTYHATIEAMHIEELTHGNKELPLLLLCDTFNRVVWYRQGYNIGLADQLMDALRKVILKE